MPQSTQHNVEKIVHYLMKIRKSDTIIEEEIIEAINRAGLGSDKSRKAYTKELESAEKIRRVPGGWELDRDCYRSGRITITVSPAASLGKVEKAVADAVRRFQPLVTMEMEL